MSSFCTVEVTIAVSENGEIRLCEYDENNLQKCKSYKDWLDTIRADKHAWARKTIRVNVPYPSQYEDMTKGEV